MFVLSLVYINGSISISAGENHLFSCSGTIIEFLNGICSVVTSASLIRCMDKDEQADELKVTAFSFSLLFGIIVFLQWCH